MSTGMLRLACARRRVQSALPRVFAFSTTVPKQDAENPVAEEVNDLNDLSNMLNKTGEGVSPIIPESGMHGEQKWNSFRASRVISPADLTYQTRTYQPRWGKKTIVAPPSSFCRYHDPFYQLDLDPRDFTSNTVVLSGYLSELGKIQNRAQTSLTAKNQRLLGKTIRRAKMMGIIPHFSILTSVQRRMMKRRAGSLRTDF